jgi:hypothetical protein
MPAKTLVEKMRALCQVGHVLTAEDCDLIEEAATRVEELSDFVDVPGEDN